MVRENHKLGDEEKKSNILLLLPLLLGFFVGEYFNEYTALPQSHGEICVDALDGTDNRTNVSFYYNSKSELCINTSITPPKKILLVPIGGY